MLKKKNKFAYKIIVEFFLVLLLYKVFRNFATKKKTPLNNPFRDKTNFKYD